MTPSPDLLPAFGFGIEAGTMNRPTRQLTHLDQKLADKASRRGERPKGKKEKRWRASAAKYRPLVEGAPAES